MDNIKKIKSKSKTEKCLCCGKPFTIKRNPNQKYCSKRKCQLMRKNKWRKNKLRTDADYRSNQQLANKRWRKKNPDYWRKYRQSHPKSVEKNRKRQREKKKQQDKRLLLANETRPGFAKSDALNDISSVKTGIYLITPVTPDMDTASELAKSDALIVKISAYSDSYSLTASG